jgi:hypothetical protein
MMISFVTPANEDSWLGMNNMRPIVVGRFKLSSPSDGNSLLAVIKSFPAEIVDSIIDVSHNGLRIDIPRSLG